MTKKTILQTLGIAAITLPLSIAFAREPKTDVGRRHPNLDAAQNLVVQAFDRVTAAQKANEFDLGGHAAKAKEALRIASDEMKLAAQSANKN